MDIWQGFVLEKFWHVSKPGLAWLSKTWHVSRNSASTGPKPSYFYTFVKNLPPWGVLYPKNCLALKITLFRISIPPSLCLQLREMFGFVSNAHKTCKFIPAFIVRLICWLKLFIRSLFTVFWLKCKQKQEKVVARDYYWIIKFNSGPFFAWQNIKIQTDIKIFSDM